MLFSRPRELDRWHKVEDNSGVTQFWPVMSSQTVLRIPKAQLLVKQQNGGVTTNHYTMSRNQQETPIWSSSYPSRSTIIVRKPRGRRLFRNFLCCFGIRLNESQVPAAPGLVVEHYSPKAPEKLLLPPVRPVDSKKKCLIIDLDETLVHSSFKPVKNPDFIIPVEIDGIIHQVYVLKRPHVDEFLQRVGNFYECILFTASLAKYADPVANLLDKWGIFRSRLFREACVFHKGNYVKDLNRLGRDLKRVIIVDNSPASYAFHPENAVPVQSWFDDMNDRELLDILPLLEKLAKVDNVYPFLRSWNTTRSTSSASNAPVIMNGDNGNFALDRLHLHMR